jgi:hypothetical protein
MGCKVPNGNRNAILAWCLYDWASSAFPAVITTFIFATYFTQNVAPDPVTALAFWRGLIEAGVYVNLALPPATPFGYCLLRASICAAHTEEQLDRVIAIFAGVATKLGLIDTSAPKVAARA